MRERRKLKLFKDYRGFTFDDTIRYLLPSATDSPIKVVTNDMDITNNNDRTLTINQKIYPEEMYKVGGKLYMKWHGEWYEMER